MQIRGEILAPEVVGVGLARGAQRLELFLALFDELVVVLVQLNPLF